MEKNITLQEVFDKRQLKRESESPLFFWQTAFLFLWILFCLILCLRVKFKKVYLILIFFLMAITAPIMLWYAHIRAESWAIVKDESLAIYIGPDKTYPIKSTLKRLDDIRIINKKADWLYVDSDLSRGWVESKGIYVN